MSKRKETPDVLGSLLGGDQPAAQEPVQDDSKPAKQQAGKPSRQPAAKPAAEEEEEKIKATFYLSPGTVYALDEAKSRLRRMIEPERLTEISKSSITEEALQIALEELAREGEDSRLAKRLA